MVMTLAELLKLTGSRNGSDLHLTVGARPLVRVQGELQELTDGPSLTPRRRRSCTAV